MRQTVKQTKRLAQEVADNLPARLLKPHGPRQLKVSARGKANRISKEVLGAIEQSYDQLEGEYRDWLAVARKYEGKVHSQDRYDVRHNILIELATARARDGRPIPLLRAYRIASFTRACYWRDRLKREVKVCIYNGVATEPKCASCRHKAKICPYQAYRPVQSLDQTTTDGEGYESRLMDIVADDTAIQAIDIDSKVDASQWQLGCPVRLLEVAKKRRDGIPLTGKDRKYLCKMLKRYQKPLF